MGSLKINRVSYSGKNYYYDSPELDTGINIIVGENGSGKSTFSFLVDYGLGGSVDYFKKVEVSKKKKKGKKREYALIVNDENNYVLLDVSINDVNYKLKRYINHNEIFIDDGSNSLSKRIFRQGNIETFSDWLLSKLNIEVFELTLGRHSWLIGFKDLYRLMYYDQETSPIKVFKSPDSDNFISDSDVIRKSIFETLLGKTSEAYNKSYSAFRKSKIEYETKNNEFNDFCSINNLATDLTFDLSELAKEIDEISDAIDFIEEQRMLASLSNSDFNDNKQVIDELREKYLQASRDLNDLYITREKIDLERARISCYRSELTHQIDQISKIIFTHDKLNLFSNTDCPFCSKPIEKENQNICICGNNHDDHDSVQFIYTSNDYLDIHRQKTKKLSTIEYALEGVDKEIKENELNTLRLKGELSTIEQNLSHFIKNSTDEGNLVSLTALNVSLNDLNDQLYCKNREYNIYKDFESLRSEKDRRKEVQVKYQSELDTQEKIFNKDNKSTIRGFEKILKSFIDDSSLSCTTMSIGSDYMPLVDGGIYREKSSAVTVRMMYYYSMLAYSLANSKIKFPRFLIVDTPEESGIDNDKLLKNISLLSQKVESYNIDKVDYQIILTTGEGRYPDSFESYVKEKFKAIQGEYILKKR
ncbi:hypothetical protein KUV99_13435 [Vibrio harveyi]|uniref:hypothetical protein n=1 Tax=Vibrio harveyi TaxID=669 RepID=UPI001C95E5D3|nr:hypothetical protein [Vibrio harveyi]MBY6237165.1 hypothetical protein [Vibrio harveyi]